MSYLVFNEGFRAKAHAAIKVGTTVGLGGILLGPLWAYSDFSNSSHQWFDKKFFNSTYHFDSKLNQRIFEQCSKFSRPYDMNFIDTIKNENYDSKFNNQSDHAYDHVYRITKKIFNKTHDKFYLIKITFDDDKIYNMESIIFKNSETSYPTFKKLDLNKILPKDKNEYKKK